MPTTPFIGWFEFCLVDRESYQTTSGNLAAESSETVGELMRYFFFSGQHGG